MAVGYELAFATVRVKITVKITAQIKVMFHKGPRPDKGSNSADDVCWVVTVLMMCVG